jgi:hypothetical protein
LDQPSDPEKRKENKGMAIENAVAVCLRRVLVPPFSIPRHAFSVPTPILEDAYRLLI